MMASMILENIKMDLNFRYKFVNGKDTASDDGVDRLKNIQNGCMILPICR
jgi:hypothetical protein